MKISIVTVAFNEEKNIAKTIESVLNQTSNAIEYIICDGKSTDKTVEIANSYKEQFAIKGIDYIVNSEKDSGIYGGMNKGIDIATGEYIFFLNAGDWFYSDDIIEKIIEVSQEHVDVDFIYGNVAIVDRGFVEMACGDDSILYDRMSVPHQALFSATKMMKANKFNEEYKICADYEFLLNRKIKGAKFERIDLVIAYFSADGVSNLKIAKLLSEMSSIRKKYGLPDDKYYSKKNILKAQLLVYKSAMVPQKLREFWRVKVKGKTLYKDLL